MLVEVSQKARGDFVATVFELPDGRVIVTDNLAPGEAVLFRSEAAWLTSDVPEDALETYDSVTDAFLDVLPAPAPIDGQT